MPRRIVKRISRVSDNRNLRDALEQQGCRLESRLRIIGGCIRTKTDDRAAALAMKRCKSVDFTGYWQRHVAD
jgi:hypothetical protein